jgi:hypothetical protein
MIPFSIPIPLDVIPSLSIFESNETKIISVMYYLRAQFVPLKPKDWSEPRTLNLSKYASEKTLFVIRKPFEKFPNYCDPVPKSFEK